MRLKKIVTLVKSLFFSNAKVLHLLEYFPATHLLKERKVFIFFGFVLVRRKDQFFFLESSSHEKIIYPTGKVFAKLHLT